MTFNSTQLNIEQFSHHTLSFPLPCISVSGLSDLALPLTPLSPVLEIILGLVGPKPATRGSLHGVWRGGLLHFKMGLSDKKTITNT